MSLLARTRRGCHLISAYTLVAESDFSKSNHDMTIHLDCEFRTNAPDRPPALPPITVGLSRALADELDKTYRTRLNQISNDRVTCSKYALASARAAFSLLLSPPGDVTH